MQALDRLPARSAALPLAAALALVAIAVADTWRVALLAALAAAALLATRIRFAPIAALALVLLVAALAVAGSPIGSSERPSSAHEGARPAGAR